jgi:hypothetical protein
MDRFFVMAERHPLAYFCEAVALLSVVAATYELALALPSEAAAYGQTFWPDLGEYACDDGLGELGNARFDELGSAPSAAAMLPLGSESLPSRLVGLGCALLGVASSLYGRVRSQADSSTIRIVNAGGVERCWTEFREPERLRSGRRW